MYDVLNALLSDKKGGLVFECFDLWHIGFLLCVVLAAVFLSLYLRKRNDTQRSKVINAVINIAFGLYVLDFFLMPFAFEQIYIEKLPFHVCTAMCVMCFLSRYNSFLAPPNHGYRLTTPISSSRFSFFRSIYPPILPVGYSCIKHILTKLFHNLFAKRGFHSIQSLHRIEIRISRE